VKLVKLVDNGESGIVKTVINVPMELVYLVKIVVAGIRIKCMKCYNDPSSRNLNISG